MRESDDLRGLQVTLTLIAFVLTLAFYLWAFSALFRDGVG